MTIFDQIKSSFKSGNNLMKLIYVNGAVFLIFKLIDVFAFLFRPEGHTIINPIKYFVLPANTDVLTYRPWTAVSYMFLHEDFLHILFNMLWLWWFGKIFIQYLGNRKILPVYLIGGLAGALFFILAFNIFPVYERVLDQSFALGASASVIAIVIAISLYKPDLSLNLMFLGSVKLKYIALVTIIIDVLSIPSMNSGGHIAHLGGAAFGAIYALQIRKGKNIMKWFESLIEWVVNPKPRMRVKKPTYKKKAKDLKDEDYNFEKNKHQAEIDRILDKISKSGYESLNREEKEKLFNTGK